MTSVSHTHCCVVMILSLEEWVTTYSQRSKHLGDPEILADCFLTRKSNFIFLFVQLSIYLWINKSIIYCVCVCLYIHVHTCVWESLLSFSLWVSGLRLKSSGLMADAFTC